jgi:type I restriction enzyme S subunit
MSEWSVTRIGDVVELITKGTTPTTIGGRFVSEGINFVKSESISYDGRIDKSLFVHIDTDTHERLRRSQLQSGDILFSIAGVFLGKNAIVTDDILPANTNQALAIIRVDERKINRVFLHYFFRQESIIELVNNFSSQSAQPNINFQEIRSIEISLPSILTQNTIVEILSSLDSKIDLLARQNSTLEALVQTYFRQWFLEENGNEPIAVSKIATLENNNVNPGRQPLEPFYHYSIPAYDNAQTPAIELGKTILSNKFVVQPNSILVSKLNPITPRIWRIDENVMPNSVCSTEFQVLKPCDISYYFFLYCLMKSNDVISSFAMSATGTSGSHQRIRPEYILEVETPAPDDEKLALFNEICTPMMKRVKKNQKQILTLQKLRDTLLPKLISGEVRVNI